MLFGWKYWVGLFVLLGFLLAVSAAVNGGL